MKMKYFFVLTFFLYYLQFGLADNSYSSFCPEISKIKNYKSKLVLKFDKKNYLVEEFAFNSHGKLTIKSEEDDLEIYYFRNHPTQTRVFDRLKNTCKPQNFKSSFGFFLDEDNKIFVGYLNKGNELSIGPTSVLALISNSYPQYSFKLEYIRGIKSVSCTAQALNHPYNLKLDTLLKISDYDEKKTSNPITSIYGYNLLETYQLKKPVDVIYSNFINLDLDKYKTALLDDFNKGENFWILPEICKPLEERPLNIKFFEKFEAVIEQMDELKSENSIKRKVIADLEENYYRFDDLTKDLVKILDFKSHFEYEIQSTLFCEMKLKTALKEEAEIHFAIQELKDPKKFNYIGQEIFLNVVTSVYRKENKIDDEKKEIYTVFVKNKPGSLVEHENEIIKITKHVYELIDEENILTQSLTFNIFDFKIINNDQILANYFDLTLCLSKDLKSDIALIAPNNFQEDFSKLSNKDFETSLRKLIIDTIDGSIANVPKIKVNIDAKEIVAQVEILEPVNPLFYFEDSEGFSKTPKSGIYISADNVEKCAIASLKVPEVKAFQFCDGLLVERTRCELYYNFDFAIAYEEVKFCKIHVKLNLPPGLVYETLKDKIDKISKKIFTGSLYVQQLDHSFNFEKIHFYKEETKTDSSELFKLVSQKTKVKSQNQKRIIKHKNNFNLGKCYAACIDSNNDFKCDSFSYCVKDNIYIDCSLSVVFDDETKKKGEDPFEIDNDCDFYVISPAQNFQIHEQKKIESTTNQVISSFEETSSLECAQKCLDNNKGKNENNCLTFQVCEDENQKPLCTLNTIHTLWQENSLIEEPNCNVFSAKHIINYDKVQTKNIPKIKTKIVETIDQCATLCELTKDCDSFNLCENDSTFNCEYHSEDGQEKEKKKSELLSCQSYIKKKELDFKDDFKYYEEIKTEYIYTNKGYTLKGFIGFVFLIVFVGLLVGAVGYYVHKSFIKKNIQIGDFAVNFSNFDNDL